MKNKMQFRNKEQKMGYFLLGIFIFLAIVVPLFSPYEVSAQQIDIQNQGMSWSHWFGTDKFGRDIFTRVWYGAGISLTVGIVCTGITTVVGVIYGGIAGYSGTFVDTIMMRITDIVDAVPSMLYVILIMLVLEPGMKAMILGISIAGWTKMARIVRGEILRIREKDYILAAKMTGASVLRILLVHIFPNIKGPLLIRSIFMIPEVIFTESFLSFVGVGITVPNASLGMMIQESRSQMMLYPGQMLIPTMVLCGMILSFHLIGTGIEAKG